MLLLVVDTLRADHLGLYGYPRATSPALDEWANRGVVFERAWATSSWTLPSFASIWTGLSPVRHGAGRRAGESTDFSGISPGSPTMGEELGRGGWASVGVATNRFLHEDYGFARGFTEWDHAPGLAWRDRRAAVVVDRALRWLEGWDGSPTLLMLHFFDPHMPYDPPASTRGRFSSGIVPIDEPKPELLSAREIRQRLESLGEVAERALTAAYDEEIAYVDQELNRLFLGLEARRLFSRSLIVLTSDHGEELFEHGSFEHGHSHHEEVLRVPLVVWSPWAKPGRRKATVSLVDLYPTLVEAAGRPRSGGLDGVTLRPILEGRFDERPRAIFAHGNLYGDRAQETVIFWPWKRIVSPGTGATELFHLGDDPREQENLENVRTRESAALEKWRERLASSGLNEGATIDREMDAETREELRSLGYL